jgi:hypothetical protein
MPFTGKHVMLKLGLLLVISLAFFQSAREVISGAPNSYQQMPPRLFYSDLLSGPASGGEKNQGSFVTLYGVGFGRERGTSTVTINGTEIYEYRLWSDNKIIVQIGAKAESGPISVHLAGIETNALPFKVRSGQIYFVGPTATDKSNGSFAKPWHSLIDAKDHLHPGDILYVLDGFEHQSLDKYESALSIQTSGTEDKPIAIVAYPGATAKIGSLSGPRITARTPNIDRTSDHWVLAGLTFLGAQEALDVTASTDWRVIGNDFSCPKGFGPTGCIEFGQATNIAFLGNTVHDVAPPGTTKEYHAVYFTTDSNHIDFGWNTIANVRGCRGLQFHSSPLDPGTGRNQYDLHIHDNRIHDVVCDAINLATIDPSKGPVEVYNNLIYNVGTGPDPDDGGANYSCVYVQGGANSGSPGTGTVQIFNNTMFNCGSRKNTDSGALALSGGSPDQYVSLRNNIIVLNDGLTLLSPNSIKHSLQIGENLCWPTTSCKQAPTERVSALVIRDPQLRAPASGDFNLQASSPAIGTAVGQTPAWDLRGMPRNKNGSSDMGALQYDRQLTQ